MRPFRTYFRPATMPFWWVHATAIVGAILVGFSWELLLLAVASYFFRMFFITAAYHRYFSHRTFKTSRAFQFVLAFFGATATQKGALWWASHHRQHHKYSDAPQDPHSPVQGGLWWSHVGWLLSPEADATDMSRIKDFAKFPELRWLNRYHLVPTFAFGIVMFLMGSWEWVVWGYFVSTVMLWHGTFTINSLTHVIGRKRFPSGDESRNHWLLAIITMGEGWHNNHHYYQSCARQGFYWWEYDVSYYVIRALSLARLVWDVREPPARVLELGRERPLQPGIAVSELPATTAKPS